MLARQITFCFLLLVGASVCAQDEHRIQTKVDDVTVYQRGAQIRRSAAVRIDPGRQAIVFTGLPTSLVEQSIQVHAPNSNLIIVGVRYRLHYTEVGEENTTSQSFTADQEALARIERRLNTRLAIGQEEEAVLAANRNLGGSDSGLDADELERGVRYHRERITAIRMQRLELSDSIQLIEDQQRQLAATFSQASLDSTTVATGEVVVELESEMATSDSIYLTYLVAEAGWEPVYDLRLTDTDRPLGLSYGARVSQESGENWESVRLTLSTGDPGRSARLPELMPWRLAPYLKPPTYMSPDPGFAVTGVKAVSGQVTDESGLPLIGVMIVVSGTRVSTVTDIDGAYSIPLPPGEKFLQFSYTGYESLSVPVTGTRMDVKLSEGSVMLEEVVVVGYGRQSSLAGAVRGLATSREPASVPLPVTIDRRPTTLNFVVDLPYTIPSGESSRLVKIQDYTVPAEYRHTAVPKVDDRVFLSAVVHDWE
ncbi:MAG: mucoidy inhibitor MuiA family protein, partial [Lewinella sp.]